MKTQRAHDGFTIIEVILFLAVTAAMIAGLFIGVGSSIGAQRYRDAVESFKSTLQQQYADVTSVKNLRTGSWVCTVSGSSLTVAPNTSGSPAGTQRGQGPCTIAGKYVNIRGGKIAAYPVIVANSSTPTGANDIAKMRHSSYVYGVVQAEKTETTMEWGTKIAWPTGTSPSDPRPTSAGSGDRALALLIIRSPDSGNVYTFSTNTVPATTPSSAAIRNMIIAAQAIPGRAQRLICIASDGLAVGGDRGVIIESLASDASGVRVAVNTDFSGAQRC